MRVCDICWDDNPRFCGRPTLDYIGAERNGNRYLFGEGNSPLTFIELCETCMNLFRTRNWHGLADRSDDALKLRLGLDPTPVPK